MSDPKPFPVRDTSVTHVLIELFGGDNNLSSFVLEDLQEMAAGNAGPHATLALADFADEGGKVIEVSRGAGMRVVETLGEIDTGDPETLADFIARALVSYAPGVQKALGFWDHGTGVFDEHDDSEVVLERRLQSTSRGSRSRSMAARRLFIPRSRLASDPATRAMLHDDTNGGVLTNREAHAVVKTALTRAGVEKVAMIFSDTCLNGMIEVLEQFRDFADVIVGSEDLEPGDGWDYQELLRRMSAVSPADADAWGRQAVEAFEAGYEHRPQQHPCTLGAFRTRHDVTEGLKRLVQALDAQGPAGFRWLHEARMRAQAFARHDTYDIRDLAAQIQRTATDAGPSGKAVGQACQAVIVAFDAARVHAIALGAKVRRAHGLAMWVPASTYAFDEVSSTYARLRFDEQIGWTAYLKKYFQP